MMANSNIPALKVERDESNRYGLPIKPDPDAGPLSSSAQSDEDLYEDAGDLEFANADKNLMLARLPKSLWEVWSKLDDDQEITIGTVRLEGQIMEPTKMSLMLHPHMVQNKDLPKEYNMHISHRDASNTFIFSEKDMPGDRQFLSENAPLHWVNRKKQEMRRQHGRTGRRAIPKRTALKGRVRSEINCQPVENDEYERITARRAELALRPKEKIKFSKRLLSTNNTDGPIGGPGDYSKFINKAGPAKKKGQNFKAARIPQNELLDQIFEAFKLYQLYSFQSLKGRIRQPDVYLRQVLDLVAFQHKTGPYASKYELKDQYKASRYEYKSAREEAAPDPGPLPVSFDSADDVDADDMVEMEDVAMG